LEHVLAKFTPRLLALRLFCPKRCAMKSKPGCLPLKSFAMAAVDAKQVAAFLKHFALESGPSFVKYDENEKCKDTPILPAELKKQKPLMRALLQFPKAITKSMLTTALDLVYDDLQESGNAQWQLTAEAKSDWALTVMRRLSNAQHVLLLAKAKAVHPKWLKYILEDDSGATVAGETGAEQEQWLHAFCMDTKMAYRYRPGHIADKELATRIVSDMADHEPIVANYHDGSSAALPELTCKGYRDLVDAVGTGVLWRGEHCVSKNNLRVQLRADRGILVSLFEQSHQVCQVPIDTFETVNWRAENRPGKNTDEGKYKVPNTKEARDKAEKFMVQIGKSYAADQISKDQLFTHRDSLLDDKGLKTGKGNKRKAAEPQAGKPAEAKPSPETRKPRKASSSLKARKSSKASPSGKSTASTSPEAGKSTASPPTEAEKLTVAKSSQSAAAKKSKVSSAPAQGTSPSPKAKAKAKTGAESSAKGGAKPKPPSSRSSDRDQSESEEREGDVVLDVLTESEAKPEQKKPKKPAIVNKMPPINITSIEDHLPSA